MSLLLKTLILYTSDSPELMLYFSRDFTKRLNENHILESYEDKNIANVWMMNSLQVKSSNTIEKQILEITKKLKSKTIDTAFAENQVQKCLEENPVAVSTSVLIPFHFWSFVANIKSYQTSLGHLEYYEKYASIIEKDRLESLVDLPTARKIEEISNKHPLRQKQIQILGPQNCLVYINGQMVKSEFITLPQSMHSTISAVCSTGNFSKTFLPEKENLLKIEPRIKDHMFKMPSLSALPKNLIAQEKPAQVGLIYWSKKENYIDALILETKKFTTQKSIHLKLETTQDFDNAGDRLSFFLENHEHENEIPL